MVGGRSRKRDTLPHHSDIFKEGMSYTDTHKTAPVYPFAVKSKHHDLTIQKQPFAFINPLINCPHRSPQRRDEASINGSPPLRPLKNSLMRSATSAGFCNSKSWMPSSKDMTVTSARCFFKNSAFVSAIQRYPDFLPYR